jgi:UDP-2-acetamido-2,6-beta-L-arabino-hexul-4-ose reductase
MIDAILGVLDGGVETAGIVPIGPEYVTTVGAVADAIRSFAESRSSMNIPAVGTGLLRALYATYVSSLPVEQFAYPLRRHEDPRGVFAELLRTSDSGQFSFFTAHPGVTRGGHYHHTKTEKFLVVQGAARFGFRHVVTGERHDILVDGRESRVVETVPGWVHDITNIGEDEMIVLLWANEAFDEERPDTVAARVIE